MVEVVTTPGKQKLVYSEASVSLSLDGRTVQEWWQNLSTLFFAEQGGGSLVLRRPLTHSRYRGGGGYQGGSSGYSNGHSSGPSYGGGFGGGYGGGAGGDRMSNLGAGLKTQQWGMSAYYWGTLIIFLESVIANLLVSRS